MSLNSNNEKTENYLNATIYKCCMATSLLFPLDQIKPTEFLTQYSEWIYFTLMLVFFISVAGITLRKHFDKAYVKPLIISVGLMLTVGIFKFKHALIKIFEGWGILGTVLLGIVAATIPYGLSRGFGLSGSKSFYLTYILFYILSWVQFPEIYYFLGNNNLGIVNLGLLILFFVAIFKVVKFGSSSLSLNTKSKGGSTFEPEIDQEIDMQGDEQKLIKKNAEKMTQIEIRTINDIAESLAEIQRVIDSHRNNLPTEERKKITRILKEISKREEIFKKSVQKLQKTFKRIGSVDATQLKEKKERIAKVDAKERQILKAEIAADEEKLIIEKKILEFEERLDQYMSSFNKYIGQAVEHIRGSPYPYDAKPYLEKGRVVLKDISEMLKDIKALEDKLVKLIRAEKGLLKKEKEVI